MRSGIGGVLHIAVAVHAVPCRTQSRRALQKKPAPGLAMTAMPVCRPALRAQPRRGLRLQSGPSLGAKTREGHQGV